ncbi:MAG: rhodanese-like domain-containing protein [Deltaproteobacteria bacterium]|nr:rhodanese-like domain-containing protein [Deltaproteobacteria bacterium]
MIVDARPYNDYLREHIKGAVSIPFYDMDKMVGKLPKDIWIITYCACPHAMAKRAADKLRAAGYDKVGALDEGFNAWKGNGYQTQSGNAK